MNYQLIRVRGSDRRKNLRQTDFVGVAMKNQSVRIAFAAIAAIFGAVLLTTCTVGLGDSVDTKAPAVSITYPPVQSIIKNTFTLRGTASDDNELVGVRLTITNTGVVDSSGYTTGDWEYLNVPAITPPQGGDNRFKQVNLDFDTSNRPVVGYLGTNLEFGTWVDE